MAEDCDCERCFALGSLRSHPSRPPAAVRARLGYTMVDTRPALQQHGSDPWIAARKTLGTTKWETAGE